MNLKSVWQVSWQYAVAMFVVTVLFASCSPTRFLDEDEKLLDHVKVVSNQKQFSASDFRPFVKQEPNSRWFNLVKVPLGIYCLSPTDSTGGLAKVFRRMGEAPVVADTSLTSMSKISLTSAMQSKGYLKAETELEEKTNKRRVSQIYRLTPGDRWYIQDISYHSDNATALEIILKDSTRSLIRRGSPLDIDLLDQERSRMWRLLQNNGYYAVNSDFFSFVADTMPNSLGVMLHIQLFSPIEGDTAAYDIYRIRNVKLTEHVYGNEKTASLNSEQYQNLTLQYSGKHSRLYRRVYRNHISLHRDSLYREREMRDTYRGLNNLDIISHSTVRFTPVSLADTSQIRVAGQRWLDADIDVTHTPKYGIMAEVSGTNTAGDLGASVGLTFTNRNMFRGAEIFSIKLRGAYEAITQLEGYDNQTYTEFGAEMSLRFPTIKFPLMSRRMRAGLHATQEVSLIYNLQDRPEFHRRVLTGNWTYRWYFQNTSNWQHRFDVVSLNFVHMPWISETFYKNYLVGTNARTSILRNSYEDLLIMNSRYGFTYTSLRERRQNGIYQTNGYQIRFTTEVAGNLLYAFSDVLRLKKDGDGAYNIFDIAYSQYAKFDFDFAKSFLIDENNSIAFHFAAGVAIPYANSKVIPYEKRYFAGGPNHVRGWSVRELGPGAYHTNDGNINFINQTGNLNLLASLEYRTHLFWKFSGAAFVDAGNIWNTRDYAGIENGCFRFDTFYRQIAVGYGLGIRFNMDYFIVRFDAGMKAVDPRYPHGEEHYPIFHPRFSRDFAFHFAVGLPF